MSCCPSNALGKLQNEGYKEKGIVETVDDLDIYYVGQGPNCIIWNYDIYGFNGGRTRQMCDFFADNGYLVILPDYYRGEFCDPTTGCDVAQFIKDKTNWEHLRIDWEEKILPFAEIKGAKTFGAVGTCWGSFMVLQLAQYVSFKAGVSFHPSHPSMCEILLESEEDILKSVKCHQVFMPADGDHPNTLPDGLGKRVMEDALQVVPFPDMKHGWSVRGDLNDPKVKRDVEKCFNLALSTFGKYLLA